ncbi:hypothetical protein Moror_17648 [Moniliophthora roreri MCA 2997]|uniref:Uncharacterized protein n=1 Tax=Moniliophthora roreri (strain MCA 2997) TaxID=1381753 RepID=V2Z0G5_MONRO|nr:hypothetical protein Moror_17648 [Moniliophthora roreri MCA 2997]
MSESTLTVNDTKTASPDAIRLTIPPRVYILPGTALIIGATIGFVRGARRTGLRFLAENAHRPPRTMKGWYFYNKTKNYKMMYGGFKGAAKEAGKLMGISFAWVGIEEGVGSFGYPWDEGKEVMAGIGTGMVFSAVYGLPLKTARQSVVLGLIMGGCMKGLKMGRDVLSSRDVGRDILSEVENGEDNK